MIPIALPKWLIDIGIQVLAVALFILCVWLWGNHKENVGYDRAIAEQSAKLLRAEQDYLKKVMAMEAANQAFVDAELSKYIVKMEQGYAKRDQVIDDLRAGNLRLRKQWQGCSSSVPEADTSAGSADGEADLREAGAGDIVRLAAKCDATIEAFQAIEQGRQDQ